MTNETAYSGPPASRKELKERVARVLSENREYPIPTGGTGAPGVKLEQLVAIAPRNKDNADSNGVELKYASGKALLKLSHLECDKEPGNPFPMPVMVKAFGKPDKKGRRSLRDTIFNGKTCLHFQIESKDGWLIVRSRDGKGPSVRWDEGRLANKLVQKLMRLVLVSGEVYKNKDGVRVVRYTDALYMDELISGAAAIKLILDGVIALAFDCREDEPGSAALRNHGTAFRMKLVDLAQVWGKKTVIPALVEGTKKKKVPKPSLPVGTAVTSEIPAAKILLSTIEPPAKPSRPPKPVQSSFGFS